MLSEPLLASWAGWSGLVALVLSAALLAAILTIPLVRRYSHWRRQRVLKRWRPLLAAALHHAPPSLPSLPRRQLPAFLELWNHLHASLGSDARNGLNRLGAAAGLPAGVSGMLRGRGRRFRRRAAMAAGNLELAAAWDVLAELLADPDPALSLAAAGALGRIDPQRAAPLLVERLRQGPPWPLAGAVETLAVAGAEVMGPALARAIVAAEGRTARRLLRCLTAIAPRDGAAVVAALLARSSDEGLLKTCLQQVEDPAQLELIRALAFHPHWHVRVHAATALGRLGVPGDETILTGMLSDSQWWVRYRAAGALARLPWLDGGELGRIEALQTDRYARDILHQVGAERRLAGSARDA